MKAALQILFWTAVGVLTGVLICVGTRELGFSIEATGATLFFYGAVAIYLGDRAYAANRRP